MKDIMDLVDELCDATRDIERARRLLGELFWYFQYVTPESREAALKCIQNEYERIFDFMDISFDYIVSSQDRMQAVVQALDEYDLQQDRE